MDRREALSQRRLSFGLGLRTGRSEILLKLDIPWRRSPPPWERISAVPHRSIPAGTAAYTRTLSSARRSGYARACADGIASDDQTGVTVKLSHRVPDVSVGVVVPDCRMPA